MSKIKKILMEKKDKNDNKKRLERARKQGFDTDTIWYHVSNKDFDSFDLDKTQDGCIWLTRDLESIKNGETGASLNGDDIFIHKFYIRASKIGGWEEDKYMDDQLIQQGYDGLLLDDDIKMYHPENIRKIDDDFKNEITKQEVSQEFNSETVFYHGNENKTHSFSEIAPSFFTTDKEYAKGYGEYVYSYKIDTKKPFDTATDEIARDYYNNVFLKDELGKEAKRIEQGEHIHFNDADNFWAFIAVEEQMGQGLGYDSIIVDEIVRNTYKTGLSIVPLELKQIKPVNAIKKNRKFKL